ncbi:MAG: nitrilase-related carbon-nitrogen hydrolase, partial [Pseudobdellovibrio sp.]
YVKTVNLVKRNRIFIMQEGSNKFCVAALQMKCAIGENSLSQNLSKAEKMMDEARLQGAKLIVLPEAFNYGYNLNKNELLESVENEVTHRFLKNYSQKHNLTILAGVLEKEADLIFNKTLVYEQGVLKAQYKKIHLFKMAGLSEADVFAEGDKAVIFNSEFGRLGFLICYDLRFPELARALALEGGQMLVVSSAWGYARREHFKILKKSRAIENQVFIISADQVGECAERSLRFAGSSMILDPLGQVLVEADDLEEKVVLAEIDLNQIQNVKANMDCFNHRRPEVYNLKSKDF